MIHNTIKLSLKSLVNRGVISHRTEAYDKCVKDFSRLGYLYTYNFTSGTYNKTIIDTLNKAPLLSKISVSYSFAKKLK